VFALVTFTLIMSRARLGAPRAGLSSPGPRKARLTCASDTHVVAIVALSSSMAPSSCPTLTPSRANACASRYRTGHRATASRHRSSIRDLSDSDPWVSLPGRRRLRRTRTASIAECTSRSTRHLHHPVWVRSRQGTPTATSTGPRLPRTACMPDGPANITPSPP
jgi:hypothetical protein